MSASNSSGISVGGDMTVSGGSRVTNVQMPRQRASAAAQRRGGVDVLLITALKEEFDAAREVLGRGGGWTEHGVGGPEPYSTIDHGGRSGALTIALARPTQMGGRGTAPIATTLTNQLKPTCLAMSGVCAGNPGDTAAGDVVVASRAYQWDEGKYDKTGFRADYESYPQNSSWVRAAQEFRPDHLPSHGAATDEEAAVWLLERLHNDQDPRRHPARERYFTRQTWAAQLERLEADGLIVWRDTRWDLTLPGRARIQRILYTDVYAPEKLPFEVHVGPMASGNSVVANPQVWTDLSVTQRKILAIEMEAATIATIAHERQVPHWLVAKGVMDHADFEKDDRFKSFAATASAEVLIALLDELLPHAAGPGTPPARSGGVPGSVKREVVRRLTYDWQDLADVVGAPSYDMRRFQPGDEARDLWTWLEDRGRLADLPGALEEIGRTDLAGLLRPYL